MSLSPVSSDPSPLNWSARPLSQSGSSARPSPSGGHGHSPDSLQISPESQQNGAFQAGALAHANAIASNFTHPPSSTPAIGQRGPAIKALQQSLNQKGAHLKLDGIMGPLTQKALASSTSQPASHTGNAAPVGNDWTKALPKGLQSQAGAFTAAGKKYGIDPRFLAAISMQETGKGTSSAYRNKNNAMGISGRGGPKSFASPADSIDQMAKGLANPNGYYKGKTTIGQIAHIYAPVGASNDPKHQNGDWQSGVSKFYRSLGGNPNAAVIAR